ncbi:hypothetical protein A2U01_0075925, partial [Trifolium medium]|nr:hypothetical protein [Trifolium medium]
MKGQYPAARTVVEASAAEDPNRLYHYVK